MCDRLSPEGDAPDRWSRLTDKLESAEKTITALRTELAAAKQRVAELEAGIAKILPDFNCRMFTPYHKLLAALLPPDRITHTPGKESDDGEIH